LAGGQFDVLLSILLGGKMTSRLVFGALIIGLFLPLCGHAKKAESKNSSGLVIAESGKWKDEFTSGQMICSGKLDSAIEKELLKLDISVDLLKRGLPCLVVDLDGNGYLDFVFHGPVKEPMKENLFVVYFGENGKLKTQTVEDAPQGLAVFDKGAPEKDKYPRFKKNPGLIKYSEGDGGHVYFYMSEIEEIAPVKYFYPPSECKTDFLPGDTFSLLAARSIIH
jgi:hypothetical protein